MSKDPRDPANYKSYEENSYNTVEIKVSTGGEIKTEDSLRYWTPSDNAVQSDMTTNPADCRAKNRTNIRYLKPGDASINDPQAFSNDPIIEAKLRTNAEQQAKIERIRSSSKPSGQMNKSTAEAPLKEYDQEQ